jgi:tRNA 2-thiocytidine biosynthesis protein TtcA
MDGPRAAPLFLHVPRMTLVLPLAEPAPRARRQAHEQQRLAKRLRHQVGRAIADFGMIEDGDKVMVCLSGGKDSYTLLDILLQLQRKAPVRFSLTAVNLDQKQPGFPEHVLPEYLRSLGVDFHILEQDTYSVVTRVVPEGKTLCSLCSRMRRGALYAYAAEQGFTKIALGHHRDDLIESLLLSMLFSGKMRSMPPRLRSDDGENVVIRPLCYAKEAEIAAFAAEKEFPIIPCDLCGSQENLMRRRVKDLLSGLEQQHPGIRASLFASMGNVMPAHLLDGRLQAREERGLDPWIDEELCDAPVALRT